jgi:hypothetical protein
MSRLTVCLLLALALARPAPTATQHSHHIPHAPHGGHDARALRNCTLPAGRALWQITLFCAGAAIPGCSLPYTAGLTGTPHLVPYKYLPPLSLPPALAAAWQGGTLTIITRPTLNLLRFPPRPCVRKRIHPECIKSSFNLD